MSEVQGRFGRPGESRYRVLTQILRESIYSGEFEDQPLPTEVSLAEKYGLSRQTVRRAFQELVGEGLVYRVRGRGTFVRPRTTRYNRPFGSVDELLLLQIDTQFELTDPLSRIYNTEIASRLQQEFPDVWTLSFRRIHQGKTFCRTTVYLPMRIGSALADAPELTDPDCNTQTTVISLIQTHGVDIAEADQLITAMAANEALGATLGCPLGAPLLHIERTYFDLRGGAVELAISDFLPAYYQHRTRLGGRANPVLAVDPDRPGELIRDGDTSIRRADDARDQVRSDR
ncbi:GntR family transcriptional regulator [Nocardioides sp. CF8]|uniref:GntR family transcriptional regulator n=1 Tax=Nocardioides sp. CF8 TaxID=110319 RepID=UPI0009FDCFC6|nr:GntR family transcriptional regulator [Nocardioides sp. CF8]